MTRLLGPLLATLLAAALGAAGGRQAFALLEAGRAERHAPETPAPKAAAAVRELKPIITNLAAPAGVWVRLEAAIVAGGGEGKNQSQDLDKLAADVTADTVAYLRTLTLSQIEGADGLRHLREDLTERAAVRSGGRVTEVIIETLVAQ